MTPPAIRRGALLGALTLYLDFINLFLMLLRLMATAANRIDLGSRPLTPAGAAPAGNGSLS